MELFKVLAMAYCIEIRCIRIMEKLGLINIIRGRGTMLLRGLDSFVSLFRRSEIGWRLLRSRSKKIMGQEQRKRIEGVKINIAEVVGE